jgi:hypothetical protein
MSSRPGFKRHQAGPSETETPLTFFPCIIGFNHKVRIKGIATSRSSEKVFGGTAYFEKDTRRYITWSQKRLRFTWTTFLG